MFEFNGYLKLCSNWPGQLVLNGQPTVVEKIEEIKSQIQSPCLHSFQTNQFDEPKKEQYTTAFGFQLPLPVQSTKNKVMVLLPKSIGMPIFTLLLRSSNYPNTSKIRIGIG